VGGLLDEPRSGCPKKVTPEKEAVILGSDGKIYRETAPHLVKLASGAASRAEPCDQEPASGARGGFGPVG